MRILSPALLADPNAAILALASHKLSHHTGGSEGTLLSAAERIQTVGLSEVISSFEQCVQQGLANRASVPKGFMASHMRRLIHLGESLSSGGVARLQGGASEPELQEPMITFHEGVRSIDFTSPHVQTLVPVVEGPLVGALTFSATTGIVLSRKEASASMFHFFLNLTVGKVMIDRDSGIATIDGVFMQDGVVVDPYGLEMRQVILSAYGDDHQKRSTAKISVNAHKPRRVPYGVKSFL